MISDDVLNIQTLEKNHGMISNLKSWLNLEYNYLYRVYAIPSSTRIDISAIVWD